MEKNTTPIEHRGTDMDPNLANAMSREEVREILDNAGITMGTPESGFPSEEKPGASVPRYYENDKGEYVEPKGERTMTAGAVEELRRRL